MSNVNGFASYGLVSVTLQGPQQSQDRHSKAGETRLRHAWLEKFKFLGKQT